MENNKNKSAIWFENLGSFLISWRMILIIAFIALNLIAIVGLSFIKVDSSIDGWFLKDDPVKVATDRFEETFGNTEYIGILIEAEDVFAPEVLAMMRELGEELEMNIPFSDKVISLTDMEFSQSEDNEILVDDLIPDPVPENYEVIEEIRKKASSKKSIEGKIFSDDYKQTWLMLRLNPFPEDWEAERKRIFSEYNALLKAEKKVFLDSYATNPADAYSTLRLKLEEFTANNAIRVDFDLFDELAPGSSENASLAPVAPKAAEKPGKVFKTLTAYIKKEIGKQTMEPNMRVGKAVIDLLAQEKYQKYTILPVGTAVNTYEELTYFEKFMGMLFVGAFVISLILLVIFLRSPAGFFIPIITTISSIILVLGFSGYLGVKANMLLITVPVLLGFAVSIGYSIHIFNFFNRRFTLTGNRKESILYALSNTGWPIFFTALTTIGSLLSFLFISLGPLRWLGVTSAAVIMSVYLIVMTMTPVFLSFGGDKIPEKKHTQKGELWTDRLFGPFAKVVFKYQIPIVVIFVLVMGLFVYGMTQLKIDINIETSYGLKVPYINRLAYVGRSKIGSMNSYNVSLNFNEENKVKDPEVLNRVEELIKIIEMNEITKRTSSILEIIKDMNQMFNEDNPAYYKIPGEVETIIREEYKIVDGREVIVEKETQVAGKDQISNLLLMYEMSGGTESSTWVNDDYSEIRIMVETSDISAQQIKKVMDDIDAAAGRLFPDAEYGISGSLPQMSALNTYVATGQIKSFLIALSVIALLMMIVFRSIKTGLIGMIPNFTPAIVVAGLLGLLNIPLDFFTVTIIPMILGLAVDDTIHFISHYKEEFQNTGSYYDASMRTFKTVGKSLFMTSVIIISGFSIYMISPAKMLFNLGIFIVCGIASALISDYLMTPIMIRWAKPFGKEKKA